MNILKTVGIFTRDMLQYDENLIRIGRQNFERKEFETDYIVIDSIGAALPTGRLESFDGVSEVLSYGQRVSIPCTADFYGANAYANASKFRLTLRTQLAYELQVTNGIGVYSVSTITDVKALTGQQYGNRVQVEFNVQYCEVLDIATLRIDTAQTQIIKD